MRCELCNKEASLTIKQGLLGRWRLCFDCGEKVISKLVRKEVE